MEQILGKELREDLFGTRGSSSSGLRHRFTHGEYFRAHDFGKNYVELIHKRMTAYFKENVLNQPLLDLDVVDPQRHFVGSLEGGTWFIKPKSPDRHLTLKDVLADFTKNNVNHLEHHDLAEPAATAGS